MRKRAGTRRGEIVEARLAVRTKRKRLIANDDERDAEESKRNDEENFLYNQHLAKRAINAVGSEDDNKGGRSPSSATRE